MVFISFVDVHAQAWWLQATASAPVKRFPDASGFAMLTRATVRTEGWDGLENTVAIAMDPKKLRDALEAVECFRQKMNALLSKPGEESKTYLLSISFHAIE